MSNKKEQLNLKGPDAFQVKASESIEFVRKNSKIVYLALGAAIVAVIAAFIIETYQSGNVEERRAELSSIDLIYAKELKTFQETRSDLEKQIDDLELFQKESKPEFDEAKLKSLQGQLDKLGEEASHQKSMALYQDFYQENPSTPEGWAAGVRYAHFIADSGDLEKAGDMIRGIYESSVGHDIIRHQSGLILISILEDQQKFTDAVAVAESLIKSSGEELKPHYLLAKARGLFLQKKNEEARAVAQEILDKYESSQESEKARGLLALIN